MNLIRFFQQLWPYVRPYQSRWWASAFSGLLYAFGTGLLAVSIKLVLDVIWPGEPGAGLAESLRTRPGVVREPLSRWLGAFNELHSQSQLKWVIAMVPMAMIFRSLGSYLTIYWTHWVSARAIHDLRVRLFSHLQGQSLDYFGTAKTGDLLSRLVNDTQTLQQVASSALGTVLRDPLTVLIVAGLLIVKEPMLTVLALIIFPVVVAPIAILGRKLRRSWKAAQVHTAELSHEAQETLTGMRVIKAYNLEGETIRRFSGLSGKIVGQFLRYIRASEFPGPMIEICGAIGIALLLYYVARLPALKRPSHGDFSAFLGSVFALYQPIKNLTRLFGWCHQGQVSLDRAQEIFGAQPTVIDPPHPKPIRAQNAPIHYDHVTFRYGDKIVLDDVSLEIRPGAFIALVGPTGSGKTTLASLLLRFQDPDSGAVRIGGIDIREFGLVQLREQIAVVTQETVLFNDTIRANLRLGRLSASDSQIEAAAQQAHAEEFILQRPQGYETGVGEKGVAVSGGQRQRLALARALVRGAPILILDEATSALDTETERAVQSALESLRGRQTLICIAHRLSTIHSADLIVVLDQGRIVEQGAHEDLIQKNGLYRRLHELQFRDI